MNFKLSILQGVVALLLIEKSVEGFCHILRPGLNPFDMTAWLMASCFTAIIYLLVISFIQIFPEKTFFRRMLIWGTSFDISFYTLSNIYTWHGFGEYISTDMIMFLVNSPDYLHGYALTYFNVYLIAALAGVTFFL